ncbi:MAG: type II secretion system F family protein [Lachnospiraceae bacterium]|nr:type II secretion system F family protein [Lachnospiraceae bacterium]
MASFGYEAIDKLGKTVKGSVDADDQDRARAELRNRGLTVLDMTEQNALNKDLNVDFSSKPTARDLSVFCRQFVSMNRAGVSILDALKMLGEATENKKLKHAIEEVRVDTEKGETLANSMAKHPKVFPELMVNMVAAGESSGSLDVSMERMSIQFERSEHTRALVKKAMIYPIVVCIVAVAVVIVMLVKVIPTYTEMFKELGTDLPALTKGVVAVSDFLKAYWLIIIPVIIGLVFAFGAFRATDTGKHFFGKLSLSIPALKNMTVKSACAMLSRTLSTLLGAGVPLVEAVEIVSKTMTNVYFKEALEQAKQDITIGKPLSQPLQESGLFPPMSYHMVRIGEETGNTEEMLDKLADYYEEEVEMAVASLMAAMEPVIIIVLAVIVGVLVGACIAPMLTMYSALDNL